VFVDVGTLEILEIEAVLVGCLDALVGCLERPELEFASEYCNLSRTATALACCFTHKFSKICKSECKVVILEEKFRLHEKVGSSTFHWKAELCL
jgi:hypothetical protein